MEQKLSDTLVKAIDRSNPMMQNLQLASRFNKLIDEGGGNTYAHKVEIKFNNFSLSYYGQESNYEVFGILFSDIANNSISIDDVSASGDLQELSNLYVIMGDPNYNDTFTKESKVAYHMYLKDADTENLVKGIGIKESAGADSREVGIFFNSGTQDKYFTNTIVLEWI